MHRNKSFGNVSCCSLSLRVLIRELGVILPHWVVIMIGKDNHNRSSWPMIIIQQILFSLNNGVTSPQQGRKTSETVFLTDSKGSEMRPCFRHDNYAFSQSLEVLCFGQYPHNWAYSTKHASCDFTLGFLQFCFSVEVKNITRWGMLFRHTN